MKPCLKSCLLASFFAVATASHTAETPVVREAGPCVVVSIFHRASEGVSTNLYQLSKQMLEVLAHPQDINPLQAMRYLVQGPDGKRAVVYCRWPPAGDFTVCRDNQGTDWLIWIEQFAVLFRRLNRTEPHEDTHFRIADMSEQISSQIWADQVIRKLPPAVTLDGRRADRIELTFLGLEQTADRTFILRAQTARHKRLVTLTGKDDKWECLVVDNPAQRKANNK